jgi:hypothetical protein
VLFVNPANQGTRHFSNPPGGALNKKNRNDFAARVVMGGRVRVGFHVKSASATSNQSTDGIFFSRYNSVATTGYQSDYQGNVKERGDGQAIYFVPPWKDVDGN